MLTFRPFAASKLPAVQAYGVGVLVVAAAIGNIVFVPMASPVTVFVLAVIVATWFGGTRAGALATVIAIPAVVYFLMPHPSLAYEATLVVRVLYFVAIAAFIIWVVGSERRAAQSLRDDIAGSKVLETQLRLVIDTIPIMAWIVLPDGRLEFLNRRWLEYAGLSLPQALAQGNETMHPDDAPQVVERWREAMATARQFEHEIRLRGADGEYRWFLVRTVPLLGEDGKVIKWYGTSTDIEDAKLAEQALRDSAGQMQHLSRRLLEVQEEERRHLARELHDEFGQLLATVTLHLHAARTGNADAARARIDDCMRILQQAGERVRSLALELRPTMLETAGLDAALRWLAERHVQQGGVAVWLGGHAGEVSGAPAIACFRVAQEALTNVMRHARARNVWIDVVRTDDDAVELVVRDDGVGFDARKTFERAAAGGRLGLLGMKERVEILGGSMQVESAPDQGTGIRIRIPAARAAEPALA
jgi:PAS domain S-box-containing protein